MASPFIVLDRDGIVEMGAHGELLHHGGQYAERLFVVMSAVLIDAAISASTVAKDATAHTILGQVPKEAFDRVSARRRRST